MCYSHIPCHLRHKLQPTSIKGILVGYGTYKKGYRVYNPSTGQVLISRDVLFNEDAKWDWETNSVKEVRIPLIVT